MTDETWVTLGAGSTTFTRTDGTTAVIAGPWRYGLARALHGAPTSIMLRIGPAVVPMRDLDGNGHTAVALAAALDMGQPIDVPDVDLRGGLLAMSAGRSRHAMAGWWSCLLRHPAWERGSGVTLVGNSHSAGAWLSFDGRNPASAARLVVDAPGRSAIIERLDGHVEMSGGHHDENGSITDPAGNTLQLVAAS